MNKEQVILRKKYVSDGWESRNAFAYGIYFDERKSRYVKIHRTKHSKLAKHRANKQIRRHKQAISNFSGYRKVGSDWLWLF